MLRCVGINFGASDREKIGASYAGEVDSMPAAFLSSENVLTFMRQKPLLISGRDQGLPCHID